MKRMKLVLNKPVYCGMSILEISKTLMYDFHYDYMNKKYGSRAKLLFMDIDSLMYELETEDFYEDIKSNVEGKFDTSDFPADHRSGIQRCNKKVIGMMKDEAVGKIIEEFVGSRAKLYSFKMHIVKEEKCKGVKKSVVKKKISHQDYKDCLFKEKLQMRKMNVIRSHRHEIFTEMVNKVTLARDDDKRVIMRDGIQSYAHGHRRIKNSKMNPDNIPFKARGDFQISHDALRRFIHFMPHAFEFSTVSTVKFIRRFSATELTSGKLKRSPLFFYASMTQRNVSLLNRFHILSV